MMRDLLSWIAKKLARAHLRCADFWIAVKEWVDQDAPASGMLKHLPFAKWWRK